MTDIAQPPAGRFGGLLRHWAIWRAAWAQENKRPRRGLRGRERDFLPAAIEIMERPASPLGRSLTWTLCVFFIIAVAWSIVGRVDIVAVAQGKVVPRGHTKAIQPLEIGVVRAIHVQDGDKVSVGQPLIDLDPTDASVDHDRLVHEQVARALDEARLNSLLAGGPEKAPLQVPPNAPPNLIESTRELLDSQWHEAKTKFAALDGAIEQHAAEFRKAQADADRLKAVMPLLEPFREG